MQFTIYARKEPSTDEVLRQHAPNAKKFDVVLYADRKATIKKGHIAGTCPINQRAEISL